MLFLYYGHTMGTAYDLHGIILQYGLFYDLHVAIDLYGTFYDFNVFIDHHI